MPQQGSAMSGSGMVGGSGVLPGSLLPNFKRSAQSSGTVTHAAPVMPQQGAALTQPAAGAITHAAPEMPQQGAALTKPEAGAITHAAPEMPQQGAALASFKRKEKALVSSISDKVNSFLKDLPHAQSGSGMVGGSGVMPSGSAMSGSGAITHAAPEMPQQGSAMSGSGMVGGSGVMP